MSDGDLSFADCTTVISVITTHHSRLRSPQTALATLFPLFKLLMWIQQSLVFNLAVVVVFLFFLTQVQECRDLKTVRLLEGSSRWIRTVC